jgi:lysophospholipase L1-like esterase
LTVGFNGLKPLTGMHRLNCKFTTRLSVALSLWMAIGSFVVTGDLRAEVTNWQAFVEYRSQDHPPKSGAIICIGSSQMGNWKSVAEDLAPLTVYNFGIGGSKMKDAADQFVDHLVIPFKPRAVILYEGSNDIAAGVSPEEFLEQFRKLRKKFHEALPETRLYVLGIVPSPGKRFEKWDIIKRANENIKNECAGKPLLTYIDTTSPLIGADGKPNLDYFIPGDIHLNATGYKLWTATIAPILLSAEKAFEMK